MTEKRRRGNGRDWRNVKKRCPKCGLTKSVMPDFGVRKVGGLERAQLWCKSCRAGAKPPN